VNIPERVCRVRSRVGRGAWCVLAALVCFAAPGCSRERPYRALVVGQCLPSNAEVVGRREAQPPIVACSERHRYEVYATPKVPDGEWPGQATVDATAKSLCYEQFAAGTGHDPESIPDGVQVLTIGPSKSGYTGARRDRSVECLVALPEDRSGAFIAPDT